MPDLAGEIHSNAPLSTHTWDLEVMTAPARERELAASGLRRSEVSLSSHAVDLAEEQFELARLAAARQKWSGQERWEGADNEARRFTRIMHAHQVLYHLRRAGVDARMESPLASVWAAGRTGELVETRITCATGRIWLNQDSRVGLIGVNAWVNDEATGQRRPMTVTSLQYPYGPQWSLMRFDKFGVLTQEKYRGWRSSMLRLIMAGVVTEEEVDRAFGPVALGPVSLFYRQQLQVFRNRRAGVAV